MINEAIDDNETGTYTVTRTLVGTWTNGKYTAGSTSTFPITASVQPMDGPLELYDAPEGRITAKNLLVLTATELKTQNGQVDPDFIQIDGEPWRIDTAEKVVAWGETHYECVAVRYNAP